MNKTVLSVAAGVVGGALLLAQIANAGGVITTLSSPTLYFNVPPQYVTSFPLLPASENVPASLANPFVSPAPPPGTAFLGSSIYTTSVSATATGGTLLSPLYPASGSVGSVVYETYQFKAVYIGLGPPPLNPVITIDIIADALAAAKPGTTVSQILAFATSTAVPGAGTIVSADLGYGSLAEFDSVTGEKTPKVNLGQAYSMTIEANPVLGNPGGPGPVVGAGYAAVDPRITIDPSTPDAGDYSLVFSPGVQQPPSSSVPDTSWTLGLMALGLIGLVAVRSVAGRSGCPLLDKENRFYCGCLVIFGFRLCASNV